MSTQGLRPQPGPSAAEGPQSTRGVRRLPEGWEITGDRRRPANIRDPPPSVSSRVAEEVEPQAVVEGLTVTSHARSWSNLVPADLAQTEPDSTIGGDGILPAASHWDFGVCHR